LGRKEVPGALDQGRKGGGNERPRPGRAAWKERTERIVTYASAGIEKATPSRGGRGEKEEKSGLSIVVARGSFVVTRGGEPGRNALEPYRSRARKPGFV